MKTLFTFSLLAALVAFAFFPIPFEAGASVLFAAGFIVIALSDYGRTPRLVRVAATPLDAAARGQSERFGLAA